MKNNLILFLILLCSCDTAEYNPENINFDNKEYFGFEGDTLASALLANDVHLVGRSFKYHRPRGIYTAGSEEPNGIVQLETKEYTEPNRRVTEVQIYEGLKAFSQNNWPSVKFDAGAINDLLSPFFPAGFYYKTFMWPPKFWKAYEFFIRHAAGLGKSPKKDDPHKYEHFHYHCDVLIVGAGVSGLISAEIAANNNYKVLLIEQEDDLGGEIVFKADWGVPQFFDGVNNKLYWNPEAKIVLDAQLDGMKRADIIDWIAVPGTEVTKGDVIARATAKDLKGDLNQEISIYAKYTGVIEEVFVSQGDTVKINEKTYDIRVTDSKPLELSRPKIEQIGTTKFKRYADGFGKSLSVGYFAIWLGVVLYTAIFISEVVRAGIMAVSKGQSEAGLSLGLGRGALLRLIVLPQAIRVMLPPMGNQYLNLAKNTSLGIAVAYPEIVAVGQTLYNQEGQTLPVFLIWMAFYSTVSLTISTIINYYNRKMKIVER